MVTYTAVFLKKEDFMISSQVLKTCLTELRDISKVEFCLQDTAGKVIVNTGSAQVQDGSIISFFASSPVDSQIIGNNFLLKVKDEEDVSFVLTATGESDNAFMLARIAVSELQNLVTAYKERYDRHNFFQDLLLDNLLLVDVASRAKKLHVSDHAARAIVLFEVSSDRDTAARQMLAGLFTTQNGDYLTEVDQNHVILIKSVKNAEDYSSLEEAAETAIDMMNMELMVRARASYGSITTQLKDLSKSYKEATMALEVGKIFYAEKNVTSYNRLGIGRLVYQLPENLCRLFIKEIFGDHEEIAFDNELVTTVSTFFENNLNVSETARKLFIHRNTLVYRIEKLEKDTGLDVRRFDDALTLQVALMVCSYMRYKENER